MQFIMEENPNDLNAPDETTPAESTTEDGGLMVVVTDSFSEVPDGGEEETPDQIG
jgi:hypothetical protein